MIEEERTPEVLREHFEECLKHLALRLDARRPPGSKGVSMLRKPIAEFCGVGEWTVKTWVSDSAPKVPVGLPEIRLKCLLDLNGYRIIEVERLPRTIRNFMEIIGFGLMSVEEAVELLGYSQNSILYRLFSQKGEGAGVSKEKESKMFDLWKVKRDDLARAKKHAEKHYRLSFLHQRAPLSVPILFPIPAAPGTLTIRQTAILTLSKVLLMLLEEGSLDELSENDLAILKEKHGVNILELSGRLSALSSKIMVLKGKG